MRPSKYRYVLLLLVIGMAVRADNVATMAEYKKVGEVKEIIVFCYRTTDQTARPLRIELLADAKVIGRIQELLAHLPANGTINKFWPPTIPTARAVLLDRDGSYSQIDVWNGRLLRDGGYGSEDIEEEMKLVHLLLGKQ